MYYGVRLNTTAKRDFQPSSVNVNDLADAIGPTEDVASSTVVIGDDKSWIVLDDKTSFHAAESTRNPKTVEVPIGHHRNGLDSESDLERPPDELLDIINDVLLRKLPADLEVDTILSTDESVPSSKNGHEFDHNGTTLIVANDQNYRAIFNKYFSQSQLDPSSAYPAALYLARQGIVNNTTWVTEPTTAPQ